MIGFYFVLKVTEIGLKIKKKGILIDLWPNSRAAVDSSECKSSMATEMMIMTRPYMLTFLPAKQ